METAQRIVRLPVEEARRKAARAVEIQWRYAGERLEERLRGPAT